MNKYTYVNYVAVFYAVFFRHNLVWPHVRAITFSTQTAQMEKREIVCHCQFGTSYSSLFYSHQSSGNVSVYPLIVKPGMQLRWLKM